MFCIKTEVKISTIPQAGKGVFALESASKGTIISLPFMNTKTAVMAELDYYKKIAENDTFPFNDGARWIGDYFFCSIEQPDPSDYINHSEQPNLLSHCGILFALQDISIGDELTLDYRGIMFKNRGRQFSQEEPVLVGLTPKEALLDSTRKLLELLSEVDELTSPAINPIIFDLSHWT